MASKSRSILTREDLLLILMEECAEVAKAASKCLRFGYHKKGPGDYGVNSKVLAEEVGDLLGVLDALPLNALAIQGARKTKIERAETAKRKYGVK